MTAIRSTARPIRVGAVGFGYWGPNLVRTLDRLEDADLVVVNTCGFIDDAVDESLETIGEAVRQFLLQLWNTYGFYALYAEDGQAELVK